MFLSRVSNPNTTDSSVSWFSVTMTRLVFLIYPQRFKAVNETATNKSNVGFTVNMYEVESADGEWCIDIWIFGTQFSSRKTYFLWTEEEFSQTERSLQVSGWDPAVIKPSSLLNELLHSRNTHKNVIFIFSSLRTKEINFSKRVD